MANDLIANLNNPAERRKAVEAAASKAAQRSNSTGS